MSTTIHSVDDLQAVIKDSKAIHVIGNGSKTGLKTGLYSTYADHVKRVSLAGLIGVTEYEPDEYTITALAGTPVKVIQDALAKNGQYLPFDPMLANTATIGGTVAANLSGSRRWRYGGVRDFILGAHVVDGLGRAFRVGGKVVKNSAGFDLTKFLVGSLGQYAIMTQITFKVFPDVPHFTTLQLMYDSLDDLLSAVYFINQSVFELDALDFEPDGEQWGLWVRMTGLEDTLSDRVQRFISTLQKNTALIDSSQIVSDNRIWDVQNSLSWSSNQNVVKVTLSPKQIPDFDATHNTLTIERRYSVGGNVGWIATDNLKSLGDVLEKQHLTGLVIHGETDQPILGKPIDNVLSDRVKQIFDPNNKLV